MECFKLHLSSKIKLYFYKLKENKRYKKFKDCYLPYPYFDEKRDTFEWVKYFKTQYVVEPSLLYAIGDIARVGVIYHYNVHKLEHCHCFDEVIHALYDYPESFTIPDEFLDEYSKQELLFLKYVKNYLLLIDLKDFRQSEETCKLDSEFDHIYSKKHKSIKDKIFLKSYQKKWRRIKYENNLKRYSNSKALEYQSYCLMNVDKKEIAKAIINGEKDYIININYSFSKPTENVRFLISYAGEFLGIVEACKEKIMKFKDLKEEMVNYRLAGFKSFHDYKKDMKKNFVKDAKVYNEEFTDESLIEYVKLKVIKNFMETK